MKSVISVSHFLQATLQLALSLLVLILSASACFAETTHIDGSNKETYERSIKAMAADLTAEEKDAFARGLINLVITRFPPAQGLKGVQQFQLMPAAIAAAHNTLDGVSREDILAKGFDILAAAKAKQAVDPKTDSEAPVVDCLRAKVQVSEATITPASFGRKFSFKVINSLPWALGGVRVEYVASSKGRSVPWAKGSVSLDIPGGIEPGETKLLQTSLSLFPDDAPEAVIVKSLLVDVADPDMQQLIGTVTVIGWAETKSPLTCGP